MEQFKLRNIDEFDRDFVEALQAKKAKAADLFQAPVFPTPETLIEPDPMQDISSGMGLPPLEQETPEEPRPLVPIGQKNTIYDPFGEDFPDTSDTVAPLNEEDFDPRKQKGKTKPGILVGKIITIALLCTTVLLFVIGCFISIFIDNNGSDIGGFCFNEMSREIVIESEGQVIQKIPEGSLIISKKKDPASYEIGNFIVVPGDQTTGCDIQVINGIENQSTGTRFTTIPIGAGYGASNFISQDQCYGEVNFYIPVLGHLINMAIADTVQMIITCAIFIIFAAVCCVVLVLLESANKKAKKKSKKE
ncbi:MAG: hypothetical protein IK080_01355, partial [Clostridia bacterium]|nr:hypothetical protein [Clostridia bacterium]